MQKFLSSIINAVLLVLAAGVCLSFCCLVAVNAELDTTCTAQAGFGDYPTLYTYPSTCTLTTVTSCTTQSTTCGQTAFTCSAIQTCANNYLACIRTASQTPAVLQDAGCMAWALNASSYFVATATFGMTTPAFRGCGNFLCLSSFATARQYCASAFSFYPTGSICQPWYTVTTTTTGPATSSTTSIVTTSTTAASHRIEYLSGNMGIDYSWTSGDDIYFTIDVSLTLQGYWVAVGLSDADMGPGKAVSCLVSASQCEALATNNDYTISSRTDSNVAFISSSTINDRVYTTVRATASLMGILPGQAQRIVFAFGTWNYDLSSPDQHLSTDRGSDFISFIGPPMTVATPAPATTTTTTTTTRTTTNPPTTTAAPSTTAAPTTSPATTTAITTTTAPPATPPPTVPPATTTVPAATTTTTAPSNRQVYISGGLGVAYDWQTGDDIYWTLDIPQADSGKWVAVGQADAAMGPGKVVACLTGMNKCSGFSTTDTQSISARTDSSIQFISATTVNSRIYLQVKASATNMGITPEAFLRIIYAKGPFNYGTQQPAQHSSSDRGDDYYYFVGPTTTAAPGSGSGSTTMDPTATINSDMFTSPTPSPPPATSTSSPSTTTRATTTTTTTRVSSTQASTTSTTATVPPPTTTTRSSTPPPSSSTTTTITTSSASTVTAPSSTSSSSSPTTTTTRSSTTSSSQQGQSTTTATTSPGTSSDSTQLTSPQQQSTTQSAMQTTTRNNSTETPSSSSTGQTTTTTSASGVTQQSQQSTSMQPTTSQQQSSPSSSPAPQESTSSTTSSTKRIVPSTVEPPSSTTSDPVLTPSPPAPTLPPQLQFTVVLRPKPGSSSSQPNVLVFQQDLANLLGTSSSNIIITQEAASTANGTVTLSIKFASPDQRSQLQDHFTNLTSSQKTDVGIEALTFAAAPAVDTPPKDEDWTMIYVALAFIAVIAVIGFFAYRRIAKMLKEQKSKSKQSMDDFRKTLMDQYSMDYGEDGEMVAAGGSAGMLNQEMLPKRVNNNVMSPKEKQPSSKPSNNNNNKKKQPEPEPEKEDEDQPYDDEYFEEEADHGVSNEERDHL